MLKKITLEHFKGFDKKLIFDLTPVKNYEFNSELTNGKAINKAMIYGKNGSGKSNLGFGILDIVSNLTSKNFKRELYNYYVFIGSNSNMAEFSFEFIFDDIFVEYKYGKSNWDEIVYETLFIHDKIVISYDRRTDELATINLKGTETLNKDLKDDQISALRYVERNSILEDDLYNQSFKKIFEFVNGMLMFRSLENNMYLGYLTGSEGISEGILSKGKLNDFEKFLNRAGVKCSLTVVKENDKDIIAFSFEEGKTVNFFELASTGTKSLALFYYWFIRLEDASFVFIDEFDAFYHFELSKLVVEEMKKLKAQVIFTTHNTSIMTNDLLRPDCYFQLENNQILPLPSKTKKDLRKAHNLEKMYRAGSFDGE